MKNIKNIILLACFIGGASFSAQAQNSNFSQYHLTPVFTSPAELGMSDYLQVQSLYRKHSITQDQGYRNVALGGVLPLYNKGNGRRFGGVGLGIMNETSGMMGMLQEISFRAGYAYNLPVSTYQNISFGFQGGYYHRNIDLDAITTDSQYQDGTYNEGANLGEDFAGNADHALKIDLGATWYKVDDDGDQVFALGMAAWNINQAEFEYLASNRENTMPVRYQVYGSIRAYKKERFQISPTFRYMAERNYSQINTGSLFMYGLNVDPSSMQESHIGLGLWYSWDKAAIISMQFIQPSYSLSISYDMPASSKVKKLQVSNSVEATLGWRLNKRKNIVSQ